MTGVALLQEMLTQSRSNARVGRVPVIRRHGFVRAALRHGVPLVPVWGSNVNELYELYMLRWDGFRNLCGMFP